MTSPRFEEKKGEENFLLRLFSLPPAPPWREIFLKGESLCKLEGLPGAAILLSLLIFLFPNRRRVGTPPLRVKGRCFSPLSLRFRKMSFPPSPLQVYRVSSPSHRPQRGLPRKLAYQQDNNHYPFLFRLEEKNLFLFFQKDSSSYLSRAIYK